LGILGFAIIKYKTADLGWLSWMISIIAGILIILLSILVLDEDEEEERESKKASQKDSIGELITELGKLKFALFVAAAAFISLGLISIIISLTSLTFTESVRAVFGSFYVLFLPGFIISYIFFSGKEIDWIERIALSFALSIAIVPLFVFYLNLIGIKINIINSTLEIAAIIIISLAILYLKSKKLKAKR